MMSKSWTERQGEVGDLRQHSREELQELLLRQEKILSNRRLVHTLPDKGKKIKEFAGKVRQALEQHDEEERRRSLVSDARKEFQSKYRQAFTAQQRAAPGGDTVQEKEASPGTAHIQEASYKKGDEPSSMAAAVETMETATAGASMRLDETKEGDLVEAFERVTLSGTSTGLSIKSKEPLNSRTGDNYFLTKQTPKAPHFVAILQKTEKCSEPRKQRFKTNQLPQKSDISPSGSSSPNRSSEGSSLLSAQARKEHDRKHLDDITAAKLPPLHHSPAQLLSLEESAVLLKEQTKKQQELQAKLAAQKLSEGLKISMGSYSPDGGSMAAYREVHDEGAQLSSDDD